MSKSKEFLSGYRIIFPAYEIDQLARDFYVASQYFYYFVYILAEIFSDRSEKYRLGKVRDLDNYFDGWIKPYIKAVASRW